jgi:hypothetical protein
VSRRRTRGTKWVRLLAVLGVVIAAAAGDAIRGLEEPAELPAELAAAAGAVPAQARSQGRHPQQGAKASLWFHPLPSAAAWPNGPRGGSRDFLALFQKNAAWPRAMAHVSVVGMYAGWITAVSDQELRHTIAFLNAHDMGIEIEAPALQAPAGCGSGVEGYAPFGQSLYDFTLAYLHRLKALGAQVPFVKVDEPFYFGSVSGDPRACRFPVPEVALAVGQFAQLVRTVYPDAAVGDVEPTIASAYAPDVVTAIAQWHDTYRAVTGAPFPFFFADIDFSNSEWPAIVRALEDGARQRGMPFGIIYTGDEQDASDDEWAGKAVERFQIYQGENGGRPDYVLFQSWEPHPRLCLPESDPATFTGVIDAYIEREDGAGRQPSLDLK